MIDLMRFQRFTIVDRLQRIGVWTIGFLKAQRFDDGSWFDSSSQCRLSLASIAPRVRTSRRWARSVQA
jgi:hypothetical protein